MAGAACLGYHMRSGLSHWLVLVLLVLIKRERVRGEVEVRIVTTEETVALVTHPHWLVELLCRDGGDLLTALAAEQSPARPAVVTVTLCSERSFNGIQTKSKSVQLFA